MKHNKNKVMGNLGENLAVKYFIDLGFVIKDLNYTIRGGEIDIVAVKDNVLHFIEVKTCRVNGNSSGKPIYEPEFNLSDKKLEKVIRAAERYLIDKQCLDVMYQIDLLAVSILEQGSKVKYKYFPNINIV